MKYIDYFAVKPEYFPQVNEKLMKKEPDLWKTFYPHESFVKLLRGTIDVISGKQKVSLWLDANYGTGKSHAVLTLKKLLEATEDETREYFFETGNNHRILTNDLFNQLQQIKTDSKKILTVHRYGSSSIGSDSELFFAIQESIIKSLEENGYATPANSLKEAILNKLNKTGYKNLFDELLKTEYRNTFSGMNADEVIECLKGYTGDSLASLIGKIMDLGKREIIPFFILTQDDICNWIEEIIKVNNLKAILFIWDEFSEFFTNNKHGLTGLQRVADMSATTPFYFLLVTHSIRKRDNNSPDMKKLRGRFNNPLYEIEIPDNIAFKLIANALEKNPRNFKDWKEYVACDLQGCTDKIRKPFKEALNLTDEDFYDILPIHPYTALVLKHISSAFDSNQRSMFDFIQNDNGEELKGFIWFIKTFGPDSKNNKFLTIDMLWEFFYERQRNELDPDMRQILDCYALARDKRLSEDEKRVFKVVLLLQAVYEGIGKDGKKVALLSPTENNINNAFVGTKNLDKNSAVQIAHRLTSKDYMLLFRTSTKEGEIKFEAYVNKAVDYDEIQKAIEETKKNTKTSHLLIEGNFEGSFNFTGFLKNRILAKYSSGDDFKNNFKKLKVEQPFEKIKVIFAFSKNEEEAKKLRQTINETVSSGDYFDSEIIIIDSSENLLGDSDFDKFAEFKTKANKYKTTKKTEAESYAQKAKEILNNWQKKISEGKFKIYTSASTSGENIKTFYSVKEILEGIDKDRYPYSIEAMGKMTETMWSSQPSFKQGALCGIIKEFPKGSGAFSSNSKNFEYMLKNAWTEDEYWKKYPNLIISKIKNKVIDIVDIALESEGKVSLHKIYDELSVAPYGFMPVNATAFILGFVLREYADGKNKSSDGINSDKLTKDKLAEIIEELIKSKSGSNVTDYREKFICKTTPEQNEFYEVSSAIFNINSNNFTDIDRTSEILRKEMKSFPYPILIAKYNIKNLSIVSKSEDLEKFIELFTLFVKENDKENIANEIGRLSLKNKGLVNDAIELIKIENIREAMKQYISKEKKELLVLSKAIDDKSQYLEVLKNKISKTSEAYWLWKRETIDLIIDEIILEYKIIKKTNELLGTKHGSEIESFENAIAEWKSERKKIKISYDYAKDRMGDEQHSGLMIFFSFLKDSLDMSSLEHEQKVKILEILQNYGRDFIGFLKNQRNEFLKICSYLIGKLFDGKRYKELFDEISKNENLFRLTKDRYEDEIMEIIESFNRDFEKAMGKSLLDGIISAWNQETGTSSPVKWSDEYCMPIKYMIPDDYDIAKAEKYFKVLIDHPNDMDLLGDIGEIYQDFKDYGIFDRLKDSKLRDEIFREKFINKDIEKIFDNIGKVKEFLKKNIRKEVYYWTVDEASRYINILAKDTYLSGKYNIAFEKVDKMNPDEAKKILKDLIKDKPQVGMDIINKY